MGQIILPFREKPKVTTIVDLGYDVRVIHFDNGTKELQLSSNPYERGRLFLADKYDDQGFPIFERLETIKKLNILANRKWKEEKECK